MLPLASPYRTLAIGLGALAVDLGGAVLVTSLVRQRLAYRAWRAVHWLAATRPGLAVFGHAVTAGNDVRIWWAALVLWGCTAAVGTAVIARLLSWLRGPALPGPAPSRRKERSGDRPLLLAGTLLAGTGPRLLPVRRELGRPGRTHSQVWAAALRPGTAAAGRR